MSETVQDAALETALSPERLAVYVRLLPSGRVA